MRRLPEDLQCLGARLPARRFNSMILKWTERNELASTGFSFSAKNNCVMVLRVHAKADPATMEVGQDYHSVWRGLSNVALV